MLRAKGLLRFTVKCRHCTSSSTLTSNVDRADVSPQAETETHFGFRTVETAQKQGLVKEVFDNVADDYDLMNDLMSGALHRLWKDEFVSTLSPNFTISDTSAAKPSDTGEAETDPVRILDVAGGTGDIAFRICDSVKAAAERRTTELPYVPLEVTVFDINARMLEVGQTRARTNMHEGQHASLAWVEGNAQALPFPDNHFDAYTIAFGIRNVTDIPMALREAFRVLKPGGRFACLEFSTVEPEALRAAYQAYSFNVIPEVGRIVTGDRDSYQYLVESIARFPAQRDFQRMIEDARFECSSYTNMTAGVVAMHS